MMGFICTVSNNHIGKCPLQQGSSKEGTDCLVRTLIVNTLSYSLIILYTFVAVFSELIFDESPTCSSEREARLCPHEQCAKTLNTYRDGETSLPSPPALGAQLDMRCLTENLLVLIAVIPSVLAATDPALQGVYDIVQRRIPEHVDDFTFKLINGTGDSFVISDTKGASGGITVSCTTSNACARGLYTYVPLNPSISAVSHLIYVGT